MIQFWLYDLSLLEKQPIADVRLGDVRLCFSDREGRDVDFVVAVVTDGN